MKNVNKLAKFRIRYWFLQHQQIITRKPISCKYVFSRWRFSQQLKRCKSLCAFTQQQLLLPHIPIFCSNTTNIHIVSKPYHTHVLNVCVCAIEKCHDIIYWNLWCQSCSAAVPYVAFSSVFCLEQHCNHLRTDRPRPPFSPVCMCMSLSCIDTWTRRSQTGAHTHIAYVFYTACQLSLNCVTAFCSPPALQPFSHLRLRSLWHFTT